MARSLAFSLTKTYLTSSPTTTTTTTTRFSPRLLTMRAQSNIPNNHNNSNQPDTEDSSSTDPLLRKLEDAIHRIIVRRAAPDWLPFLPGSSYWVPPPRSTSGSLGIAQLVEKLADPLSDEESLSMTTIRGWPSSDYFVKGRYHCWLISVFYFLFFDCFCDMGLFRNCLLVGWLGLILIVGGCYTEMIL